MDFSEEKRARTVLMNFVAQKRLDHPDRINPLEVADAIEDCDCSVSTKANLYALLKEYKTTGKLDIWNDKRFSDQAHIVTNILGLQSAVNDAKKISFNDLSFSCHLNTMIAQKIETVSDELLLTLSHYLVKDYSEKSDDGPTFYKEWVESFTGKGKVL